MAQTNLSDAEVQAILQRRIDQEKQSIGIVVGLINDKGSRTISYGKLDQTTTRKLDGDTVFEIGSITKVFTSLLLADMVKRGELSLNDPISKFLPKSVKVPTKMVEKLRCLP
ncbi:MAG: serine hydrolase [Leptolyngbyaceae cyanobacterium RU_5_1]|nr:serine hydrolase [Leptolyngbyaceae cyanobacterium RU_5_1]